MRYESVLTFLICEMIGDRRSWRMFLDWIDYRTFITGVTLNRISTSRVTKNKDYKSIV